MRFNLAALALTLFLALTAPLAAQEAQEAPDAQSPAAKPVPQIERVLIMSVDGCRPDLLLRAKTPNLRSLIERGSFSMWARTIPESITLPSHTSMLTGVHIKSHGVSWNNDGRGPEDRRPPKVPTLFKLAHDAGLTTAMAAGKQKFIIFADEGALDHYAVTEGEVRYNDMAVAEAGIRFFREHKPHVTFLHFGESDSVGHRIGWGTPEQIARFENADAAIGKVLACLDELNLTDSTLIIMSADHGGQGRHHGPNDARSRHIPWIAAGPGVRPGFDLTRHNELQIDTYDTFATACHVLGLPIPENCEGKPIVEIFDKPE